METCFYENRHVRNFQRPLTLNCLRKGNKCHSKEIYQKNMTMNEFFKACAYPYHCSYAKEIRIRMMCTGMYRNYEEVTLHNFPFDIYIFWVFMVQTFRIFPRNGNVVRPQPLMDSLTDGSFDQLGSPKKIVEQLFEKCVESR